MKRFATIVSALVLCFSLAFAPAAYAASAPYVIDEYGVLDASAQNALEQQAESIADQYQIGVYVLFTDDIGGWTARSYAINYYQENDLGVGSLKSGIMLLVAVDSRDYITITYGDGGGSATVGQAGAVDAFTDVRLDNIEADVVSFLRHDDWEGAARAYYEDSEETIAYLFANGEPMNDYYASDYAHPDEDDEFDIVLAWIVRLLGIIGIPAAVAGVTVSGEKRAMKTARAATEANAYLDPNSLALTRSEDTFVNTSLVATPRAQASDDDGGGRHGGGFGGFGHSSVGGGGFGGGHGGKF